MEDSSQWKRCSSCKRAIAYREKYWVCNVSTCNRKRTGLVFCSVSCWDAHVPQMNHRETWAEERVAPTREEWSRVLSGEDQPRRTRKSTDVEPKQVNSDAQKPAAPPVIIRRSRSE